jgi:hypothetical protein
MKANSVGVEYQVGCGVAYRRLRQRSSGQTSVVSCVYHNTRLPVQDKTIESVTS